MSQNLSISVCMYANKGQTTVFKLCLFPCKKREVVQDLTSKAQLYTPKPNLYIHTTYTYIYKHVLVSHPFNSFRVFFKLSVYSLAVYIDFYSSKGAIFSSIHV